MSTCSYRVIKERTLERIKELEALLQCSKYDKRILRGNLEINILLYRLLGGKLDGAKGASKMRVSRDQRPS